MKLIFRRTTAIFLALIICLSLTGCGARRQKAPITLTVFSQVANYSGEQVGWFADLMLEKFNVILNIVPDLNGIYETRATLGNLGDIVIFGNNGDQYKNAVNQGLLLDWEEDGLLNEHGQYIKANMKAALEANRNLVKNNEHIYGFANDVAMEAGDLGDFFYSWDIRWDLYDRLGRPEVKNLDDLYDLLMAMHELEPLDDVGDPTYALSMWPDWDGSMMMYAKALASCYYGYDEVGLGLYDPATGNFHGAIEEDGPYIEMLRFLNKLYRSRLIDPDSASQTFVEMSEKVRRGGVFMSIFDYAGSSIYNSVDHIKQNKIMLPLKPDEASSLVYELSVFGSHQIWTIGSETRYPALCMEIINWLSTPEGFMTMKYGRQGVNWDYNEEGQPFLTEAGKICMSDGDSDATRDEKGYSFNIGRNQMNNNTWAINTKNPDSNGATFNYKSWTSEIEEARNEIEKKWREYTHVNTSQEYMESQKYTLVPASTYSELEKIDEFEIIIAQVSKCITDHSWKAIFSAREEECENQIASMIRTSKLYGYDTCEEWSINNCKIRYELEKAGKGVRK